MNRAVFRNSILACGIWAVLFWAGSLPARQWLLEPEGEQEISPVAVSPDRLELDRARQVLAQGQPSEAAKILDKWLKKFPDSGLRSEAMYYAGQCCQQQGRFYEAFEKYEKLAAEHSGSDYFHRSLEAEFEIAEKFLNGTKRRALGIFKVSAEDVGVKICEDIAERWPRSLLAEKALMLLGDYYMRKRSYEDAAYAYRQIIASYPTSVFIRQARLRAAEAYLASFNGTAFDPAPLVEAKERLLEYQELYGSDAQAEQVGSMLELIEDLLAQRQYNVGKFYQRTGKKQAAMASYQQVIENWPDSDWAGKARGKLDKLGG